jgi:excisionase family DNA binding protein
MPPEGAASKSGLETPRSPRAPLLSAAEVAEILHISLRSVRRMIADGRLPIVRLGHSVRVHPEALEVMIELGDTR